MAIKINGNTVIDDSKCFYGNGKCVTGVRETYTEYHPTKLCTCGTSVTPDLNCANLYKIRNAANVCVCTISNCLTCSRIGFDILSNASCSLIAPPSGFHISSCTITPVPNLPCYMSFYNFGCCWIKEFEFSGSIIPGSSINYPNLLTCNGAPNCCVVPSNAVNCVCLNVLGGCTVVNSTTNSVFLCFAGFGSDRYYNNMFICNMYLCTGYGPNQYCNGGGLLYGGFSIEDRQGNYTTVCCNNRIFSLISGCKIHGNCQLGTLIFELGPGIGWYTKNGFQSGSVSGVPNVGCFAQWACGTIITHSVCCDYILYANPFYSPSTPNYCIGFSVYKLSCLMSGVCCVLQTWCDCAACAYNRTLIPIEYHDLDKCCIPAAAVSLGTQFCNFTTCTVCYAFNRKYKFWKGTLACPICWARATWSSVCVNPTPGPQHYGFVSPDLDYIGSMVCRCCCCVAVTRMAIVCDATSIAACCAPSINATGTIGIAGNTNNCFDVMPSSTSCFLRTFVIDKDLCHIYLDYCENCGYYDPACCGGVKIYSKVSNTCWRETYVRYCPCAFAPLPCVAHLDAGVCCLYLTGMPDTGMLYAPATCSWTNGSVSWSSVSCVTCGCFCHYDSKSFSQKRIDCNGKLMHPLGISALSNTELNGL